MHLPPQNEITVQQKPINFSIPKRPSFHFHFPSEDNQRETNSA